jgi:hypothetical protein
VTLRVTVQDVETAEFDTCEVAEGDYLLICAEPCRLHHTAVYKGGATHVLTIKDRRPTAAHPGGEAPTSPTRASQGGAEQAAAPTPG